MATKIEMLDDISAMYARFAPVFRFSNIEEAAYYKWIRKHDSSYEAVRRMNRFIFKVDGLLRSLRRAGFVYQNFDEPTWKLMLSNNREQYAVRKFLVSLKEVKRVWSNRPNIKRSNLR